MPKCCDKRSIRRRCWEKKRRIVLPTPSLQGIFLIIMRKRSCVHQRLHVANAIGRGEWQQQGRIRFQHARTGMVWTRSDRRSASRGGFHHSGGLVQAPVLRQTTNRKKPSRGGATRSPREGTNSRSKAEAARLSERAEVRPREY